MSWEESTANSPDGKPIRWVMQVTGWRREFEIIRANVGHPRSPEGVWSGSAMGLAWNRPESLREAATILNAMADRWDELAEQFPEVVMIRSQQ